jgi:ribosomal protein L7/L12
MAPADQKTAVASIMITPNPEDQAARIKDALFRGEKIQAIQLYREQTGVGLAEAKTAVESIEAELRDSSPENFSAPESKGRSMSAGAVIAAAGLLIWLLLKS